MADLIPRIQNWFKINCNGDWEHNFGLSISTLDNPGWIVELDLEGTSLDTLEFKRQYQNPNNEQDWFIIKTKNYKKPTLEIFCGPANLETVFNIFLDEIIPNHSDSNFRYDVYLELDGISSKLWTPSKAKLISEQTLELVEIPIPNFKELKAKFVDDFDGVESILPTLNHQFKVGDQVQAELTKVHDGMIQVAIK